MFFMPENPCFFLFFCFFCFLANVEGCGCVYGIINQYLLTFFCESLLCMHSVKFLNSVVITVPPGSCSPESPPRIKKNPPIIHGRRVSDTISIWRSCMLVMRSSLLWVEQEIPLLTCHWNSRKTSQ